MSSAEAKDRIAAGPAPSEPWETPEEEQEAATFGMWIFLATEVLFFGGMFLCYGVYRTLNPEGFLAGARETELAIGTFNTVVLLTSSFTMIMAVKASPLGSRRLVWRCLALTAALGVVFMAAKGYEYYLDFEKHVWPGPNFSIHVRGAAMFFALYWVMTGIHAIHLTIGILIVGRLAWLMRGKTPLLLPDLITIGLYWHFVDTVWMFLYPLLYLPGRA